MTESESSSATMRMFGGQLRMWRRRSGVSRERLAQEAGYSVDTVKSVEQGRRPPSQQLVDTAEDLCDAGGLLQDAADKVVRGKFPDWFADYARYEAQAASLGLYENHVIPGLFQTEDYARAVFLSGYPRLSDDEIERRTAARLERQELLSRVPLPMISGVVEQVAFERCIGGKQVMRGQLTRLLEVAELRHVDLQIMPTRRESHAGLNGPMYLLETTEQTRLVYSDSQNGSMLSAGAKQVHEANLRYGMLRSQALTPEDSVSLLRKTLGEL